MSIDTLRNMEESSKPLCDNEELYITSHCFDWVSMFSDYIYSFDMPTETNTYDIWYNGYWKKCSWGNVDGSTTDEWVWMNPDNSTDSVLLDNLSCVDITRVLNNIYWDCIKYDKTKKEEYVWDDYYNGWWIKRIDGELVQEDIWIWIG